MKTSKAPPNLPAMPRSYDHRNLRSLNSGASRLADGLHLQPSDLGKTPLVFCYFPHRQTSTTRQSPFSWPTPFLIATTTPPEGPSSDPPNTIIALEIGRCQAHNILTILRILIILTFQSTLATLQRSLGESERAWIGVAGVSFGARRLSLATGQDLETGAGTSGWLVRYR
jgi:hypothetical protein